MNEQLETKKLAEECGELVQISMKTLLWGIDNINPVTEEHNREAMVKEMGDVLCHLKRTANAYGIGWDEIQNRSLVKNNKVNKYHYKEEEEWEMS